MNLHDLSIRTQLRLGFSVIIVLVAALGAVSWIQSDRLSLQTQTLYDHPLQVRRALGKLELDVESMSRHLRDLFLARNSQEATAFRQGLEIDKADAERQLALLFDRYLGPRQDFAVLQAELIKWNTLRDETIRLFQAGKSSEADVRIRPGGVQDAQLAVVKTCLQKVDDFALKKAEELMRDAAALNDTTDYQSAGMVAAVMLLALTIGWMLQKGIKDPLRQLTAAAEQFGQGKLEARSRYASANEFGVLSASFNAMAETVQMATQQKQKVAGLAEVMLQAEELRTFCQELLKALLAHTGSQVGAVFLLNEAKTAFEHFESIGLGAGGRTSFSATAPEGEFGAALATRQIQRITDIPPGTRFTFAAVTGDFLPREIITIPLLSGPEVVGLISLASLRNYPATALQLLNDVLSVLTARLNGVLAFRQIREFSSRLEVQNRELEAQKKELSVQADELSEQNMELEMQKKELDEANRLKSAFLSNMSHELRTPLNSVIALSGVLSRRLRPAPVGPVPSPGAAEPASSSPAGSGDPAYHDPRTTIPAEEHGYLEVIERNGKQLLALINNILDLSRIEAGKEEFNLSRFSIHELVGEIVTTLEPQAQEKNLALRNLVRSDLPVLQSDFTKCRHILQNIVGNAVKFTEAGHVEIAAEQADHSLRLTVTDTGIGIAAEHLPHIFDEFRQADESTSRKYGGTGLGLAIAKKYAMLLRGRITVESTPGQGTTFVVTLPLTLALPAPGELKDRSVRLRSGTLASAAGSSSALPGKISGEPQFAATGPNRTPVILLVEDSEPAVIQIKDILTQQGYQVRVARNGQEALDQIAQTVPDAMILDLMMPGVDGFQVLRMVRGAEQTARLPVVILTAKHITREELSFLKGNHIQQLIQKGDISRAELLAAVAKMVSGEAGPRSGVSAERRHFSEKPPAALCRDAATPPSAPPVILVVEDNADNLKTVRALLQDSGTILEASNGQAALEQARARPPDLILLDIALPLMDGFQTLEAIRQEETLRHIPVIALTARAMKGDREQILDRGFDGYVSKPIDEAALKETIRKVLHGE